MALKIDEEVILYHKDILLYGTVYLQKGRERLYIKYKKHTYPYHASVWVINHIGDTLNKGDYVFHKNWNTLDNRPENLSRIPWGHFKKELSIMPEVRLTKMSEEVAKTKSTVEKVLKDKYRNTKLLSMYNINIKDPLRNLSSINYEEHCKELYSTLCSIALNKPVWDEKEENFVIPNDVLGPIEIPIGDVAWNTENPDNLMDPYLHKIERIDPTKDYAKDNMVRKLKPTPK